MNLCFQYSLSFVAVSESSLSRLVSSVGWLIKFRACLSLVFLPHLGSYSINLCTTSLLRNSILLLQLYWLSLVSCLLISSFLCSLTKCCSRKALWIGHVLYRFLPFSALLCLTSIFCATSCASIFF